MYVFLYIYNFLDTCSSDWVLGGFFLGLFYKLFPLFKNFEFFVWDVFDGASYLLLGFCSWMRIGWTIYFHLNFTHPCNFVILKYFGVGEYVAVDVFPSLGFGRPMATMFKVSLVGLTPTTIYKFISRVKQCWWLWEHI